MAACSVTYDLFNFGSYAIVDDGLATGKLLQSQLSALRIEFFEPVKAITAVAEQLADLRNIAELFSQLQQP